MISRPLAFRRDVHWRELSPEEGRYRWRFEYLREVPYRLDRDLKVKAELCDEKGKAWVVIDGRWWLTQPLYQWDGCSPKRWLWPFGWIGTPDVSGGENGQGGNLLASGWHDQGCQFQKTDFVRRHFPAAEIDHGFRALLHQTSFRGAEVFHSAVATARPVWPRGAKGAFSRVTG